MSSRIASADRADFDRKPAAGVASMRSGELFLGVRGDQNEAARGAASFVDEKPRESTTAAAAEVNVNECDVWAQFDHPLDGFLARRGDSDDSHSLLLEQRAGHLPEARAVVDYQAAQPHTPSMAGSRANVHCS